MFSPRTPASRSHASPFTPSLRGTPNKRGFSTPRPHGRDRSFRNFGATGSRALVSQIVDESARHKVETFGVQLPVLITEALKLADRATEVTVKVDPSGWAWLVGGRKLFVWRYKQTTARGVQCKELTLPPSDLAHSAARVCVLGATVEGQPTACVAVSPEGVVRYWPNIAYEGSTAEISAELKGEECACVVSFQPYGCLLATTTSSLLLLKSLNGQNSIVCIALKTSQGMFSGIGRRMSSFIFGASPAQMSGAPLQALVADIEEELRRCFYVLTDTNLQKWQLSTYASEKMLYQVDALRLFKDALARKIWDQDAINMPQLHVWLLDMHLIGDGVIMLGAGVNLESSHELSYGVALMSADDDEAPSQLNKLIVLSHTERYEASKEEELLGYHLLVPNRTSRETLIYSTRLIFMVPVFDNTPADRMDLQSDADQLIGAGTSDGEPVFFSSTHGMLCLKPNLPANQSIMDNVGNDSLLRSEQSTMGFNMSQLMELSQSDSKLSRLKACFIASLSVHQAEVGRMLADLFPAAVMEADAGDGGRELDCLVKELSCELIDDYPTADPRWAESCRTDRGSSTHSLIISQQLRDKVRAHDYFVDFLKQSHLWEQLTVVPVRGRDMCTCLVLCEHVEKLEAAIHLREQEPERSKVVDVCIRRLLKIRKEGVPDPLYPDDVFFREVSKIDDIAGVFLDYELEQLGSGITSRQCSHLIVTINSLLQTMVSAALVYRQTKVDNYQVVKGTRAPIPEYIPWTATSGEKGLRTILTKQASLTIDRGLDETQDVETRGVLFQQLMGLADLLLDSYSSQLESLRRQPQHSDRYSQLTNMYHDQRRKLIEPLLEYEQYDRAASLAEKYMDFDILIGICDVTDNQDRLQRYVTQFSDQGFSQHLFNWYLKEGKRGRLLSQPFAQNAELRGFLATENTRYLSWLHEIGAGHFTAAHQTLIELARSEKNFLSKRKTLLSLSKLAALADDEGAESLEQNVAAINEELTQVDLQEAIPTEVLDEVGLDPDNMMVLPPKELIRLYVGDHNKSASEIAFKTALDLLLYIDPSEMPEEYTELKLFVWCQALLRDKDRWMDTSENDPMKMRNETVFFKTVDLLYNEGEDLGQILPSPETLLECQQLDNLRHNMHFQYLLKAGYEIICNILLSS